MKHQITTVACLAFICFFCGVVRADNLRIQTIKGAVEKTTFSDPAIANPFNFEIGKLVVRGDFNDKVYEFPVFRDTPIRDAKWRNLNILSIQPGDRVEVQFVRRKSLDELQVHSIFVLTSKEWEGGVKFRNIKNHK